MRTPISTLFSRFTDKVAQKPPVSLQKLEKEDHMESSKYIGNIISAGAKVRMLVVVALCLTFFAPAHAVLAQRYSDWSAPVNLGPVINTAAFDGCPSLTKDGLSLLYMSSVGSAAQNLYVSHRETADADSPWSTRESLGSDINTAGFSEICPNLTTSGRYLYFASNRPGGCGDFDIYVARRLNKKSWTEWSEPENLGCEVNSVGPEFSPSLFEDEDGSVYLYFSSGLRPGGLGFGDLFVARQKTDGSFGQVSPLSEFNTVFNEIRPKIRARDGLEIFFDSNRPGSMSVDIYASERECVLCPWNAPVNLGPTVNSTAIDGGAAISFDATELYFMSNRSGGSGDQDIYVARREKLRGD